MELANTQAAAKDAATRHLELQTSLTAEHGKIKCQQDHKVALEDRVTSLSAAAADAERLSAQVESPYTM